MLSGGRYVRRSIIMGLEGPEKHVDELSQEILFFNFIIPRNVLRFSIHQIYSMEYGGKYGSRLILVVNGT